jgi:hypothetical protein
VRVLGAHDADPDVLFAAVRSRLDGLMARQWLAPAADGLPERLAEQQVQGRLVWDEKRSTISASIDGQLIPWAELGSMLETFEGWHFTLAVRDSIDLVGPVDL